MATKSVQIWKLKKLIKTLEAARGSGEDTMISIIIPPGLPIRPFTTMLDKIASGIHNKSQLLPAITTAKKSLTRYNGIIPPNGLVLYTGAILSDDGTLGGDGTKRILREFSVDSLKINQDYAGKTVKLATKLFTDPHHMFDPRLKTKILDGVLVSIGGECGFDQAVLASFEVTSNVKFSEEKCVIRNYFEEQEKDEGNYKDESTGVELEIEGRKALVEWFASEYRNLKCTFEIVSNKSQEGYMFCRHSGGIVCILR
ncbi:hypothetical protein ACFE04_003944 [Oxalis oulophora]